MSSPQTFFANVGKQPGITIWRVEDFKPVKQPQHLLGSFYSGDCYLILHSYQEPGSSALKYNIHFWIGKECTQDESGSVAIFAMQLDDALGGGPVQFRQAQGSESAEFLQLFPRLRYLKGGFASGFKSASAANAGPVRLYQVKSPTKTCVQVFEVPCAVASLNSGDCFLLEDPSAKLLWVWHGQGANMREKMRAVEAANSFKDGTAIKSYVLDEGDIASDEARMFFRRLGVEQPSQAQIKAAERDVPPPAALEAPRLFKAAGGSSFQELPAPPSKSQLAADAQYVLQAGGCVWVWAGHNFKEDGESAPFKVGARFQSSKGLPPATPVKAVRDRFEPAVFTTYFTDWAAGGSISGNASGQRNSFGFVMPSKEEMEAATVPKDVAWDAVVESMLTAPGQAASAGSGASLASKGLESSYAKLTSSSVKVWIMASGTVPVELPQEEYGQLYGAESYIILHDYSTSAQKTDVRHVIYAWQGRHSSNNEQGSAMLRATEMHTQKYGGSSTLVRVVQNQEPAHFARVFRGGLIVRNGNRPQGIKAGCSPAGTHLYQVKGEGVEFAHAVEVDATASSLCSGDCFILEKASGQGPSGPVQVWEGTGSSEQERQTAAAAAKVLAMGHEVQLVKEGSEPDSFWALLGGKAAYAKATSKAASGLPPRLIALRDSAATGVKAEALATFSQDSLEQDDVMLLDVPPELFVWYGPGAKPEERSRALALALRYTQAAATLRQGGATPARVVEVEAGCEPPFFTSHFPGWDASRVASVPDVYADKVRAMSIGKE